MTAEIIKFPNTHLALMQVDDIESANGSGFLFSNGENLEFSREYLESLKKFSVPIKCPVVNIRSR